MEFNGFDRNDFAALQVDGLEARMKAIQERIQPKFKAIGEPLAAELSVRTGTEMFLHIAKHARRSVNPPNDTWLAVSANKRGYKKHPHFQVGLFDDHVFVWLALIYELPDKAQIAETLLDHADEIRRTVPGDYVVSDDHTQKHAVPLAELDLEAALVRFRDVKKAEFLLGKHLPAEDPIVQNGSAFMAFVSRTLEPLIPVYRLTRLAPVR